jgi:hypothetical protein
MLPFQVGAINPPSRRYGASNKSNVSKERRAVTHFHLRRFLSFWLVFVWIGVAIAQPALCGQSKGRKKKAGGAATAGKSAGEPSLTNIPLPIGHEAKGLVLPDFDTEGKLRGKFEAGTAHRIDLEHVGFQELKITTYTPQSETDLQINMHTSVLDLKTRILSSHERTTIKRSDINIAGDSVQFDTNAKTGRLIGNVKMVITDKSHLTAKPNTSE